MKILMRNAERKWQKLEPFSYSNENQLESLLEIDGKVALRLLEGLGVLPSGRNVVVVEEAKPEDKRTPEEKHDDLVEDYLKRALRMFHVRNKVFGTPLPEVEELHPQKQEWDTDS